MEFSWRCTQTAGSYHRDPVLNTFSLPTGKIFPMIGWNRYLTNTT